MEVIDMLTSSFVMPWWGWVLIVVGVLAIGALKLVFFNNMKKKAKDKKETLSHKDED
jgi:hypothetical protein